VSNGFYCTNWSFRSAISENLEVGNLAELAFTTFRGVKRNNMMANLDICYTFSNRFNNSSTFVAENDGESPFRVLSRESISVGMADLRRSSVTGTGKSRDGQ